MVNKERYLEVMRHLREPITGKCLELWENNSWILHDDNAPAHSSLLVSLSNFFAKNKTPATIFTGYGPCDFFLFPKLKKPMKGRRFGIIEEIKKKSLEELKAIPENAYHKYSEDWKKRGAFLCYRCHQTSKTCNEGDVRSLQKTNCPEKACAVLKYETWMPGKRVLATIRGCASEAKKELQSRISKPSNDTFVHECNTDLCNSSTKIYSPLYLAILGNIIQLILCVR
ncbi:uncharacterized protein LOC132699316 [Cylas formicarius]|uniref:uncharacterized protein LOC132699316 n=1 Tax=Cylas formicarius TaxID=197179 RepID=UPI002958D202|nr:uncharacterized protein LOC132699316 [Cylas formicarius]